jgi:uncharacterized membrane protein
MDKEENSKLTEKSSRLQLTRLERLTDVFYAIVIWQLFMMVPTPDSTGKEWDSLMDYLSDSFVVIIVTIIGVIFASTYWIQSNKLFSILIKSDKYHTTVSFFQLILLLAFLYSLSLGIFLGGSAGTWAFESITVTLVGLCSWLGLRHALKDRKLVDSDLSEAETIKISSDIKVLPISTAITIPFAFINLPPMFGFSVPWELSWFIYPIFVGIKKLFVKKKENNN